MGLKTRLLKAECMTCGYIVRTTRAHLARVGPPLCPCNGEAMRSDDWTEHYGAAMGELHAAEANATRPIRETWVTLRSRQECCRCRGELPHGEYCHHAVYTIGREFFSEYTCCRCRPETASQYGRNTLAYA